MNCSKGLVTGLNRSDEWTSLVQPDSSSFHWSKMKLSGSA